VAPTDSLADEVLLEASSPEGVDVSFGPQSGVPPFSSMINISTSDGTAPGEYQIPVVASTASANQTFVLCINVFARPPRPDFEICVDPSTVTVIQGGSSEVNVTIPPIRVSPTTQASQSRINPAESQLPLTPLGEIRIRLPPDHLDAARSSPGHICHQHHWKGGRKHAYMHPPPDRRRTHI